MARPTDADDPTGMDLVQRLVVSVLILVVLGLFMGFIAYWAIARPDPATTDGDVIGLWIMLGPIGLMTSIGVAIINRRKAWSPWVLLGLLPMIATWYWVFH